MVKIWSEKKCLKANQLCRNIEALMPIAQPSIDQVLMSLTLHSKTKSRDCLDILNKFGYGIPYTETIFIEDIWDKWDRLQNNQIPANISKRVPTTLVADNIDLKYKSINGRETHNTNRI